MAAEGRHCKICFAASSKYVCPQCGINYCSSDCFRNVEKHLKCSEEFYKRCVMETLKDSGRTVDANEKERSMKEILRRFHESHPEGEVDFDKFAANLKEFDDDEDEEFVEAPLDSDDEEALESRLGEIDIEDAEKVWDKLTKEEKDDFLRMVKQAQSKGVEVVPEPWYPGQKLVEELPSSSKAEKR